MWPCEIWQINKQKEREIGCLIKNGSWWAQTMIGIVPSFYNIYIYVFFPVLFPTSIIYFILKC